MTDLMLLTLAGVVFVATHLGISSSPLRRVLVGALGENAYLGIYSLIAIAAIVWLVAVYNDTGPGDVLWASNVVTSAVAKVLMLVAFLLVLVGIVAKNPTALKQEAALDDEPQGILRITRHPVQWGILLWALSHLIANGDLASLIFFGSFLVLSGLGTVLLDVKRAREGGERWQAFAAKTSNVPFQAIIGGRNSLVAAEIGWALPLVGLVVYTVVYAVHEWLVGVALYSL